ncbi:putative histone H1.6 [Convolutriloba macropyga]|uniref:putative histone H1.6 n=1 Tax=Convolutriloba macropyga TaxID=536237 RepID=UPI003F51BB8C
MPATVANKTSTPKKTSPTKPAHPAYSAMIKKAIKELNEKGGSSKVAIEKYINANYSLSGNVSNLVRLALRRMISKKELVHTSNKSTGANGSFKLPSKEPTAKKPSPKKKAASPKKKSPSSPKPKQPAAPKKAKSPTKPKVKKAPAKKAPAKKTSAKK